MTTIGIDPGASGGIAWVDSEGIARAQKMPDTLQDLWGLIDTITKGFSHSPDGNAGLYKAYLEQVFSSPQMGVKSAFTFGNGFGHLEMALTAAGIPFERVRPQVWQKVMGCMTGGDKNVSKRRAQELFPALQPTHATADALLIAEYGRRVKP
jgi:Holliday junction resolvasome RuvABC endonuclease subunit